MVHEGSHDYYLSGLVPGRAEGTLVAGEEPGVWSGSAATTIGLVGRVEAGPFAQVMDGHDPSSGSPLRARAGPRSVAAYDLSFCAPKSVSILHLLAPRELAAEVGAGHRAAVADAGGYLERSALAVRRRSQGRDLLPVTGGVAGGFLHRTSRALDPHLHTHLVVANVAEGVDGGWSALDSRRLHGHLPAAQGIYHARLRFELTTRLGAAWEVGPTGLGDVVGVGSELRHLYSQRSADMARFDFLRHGGLGRRHGKGTFHATRPGKASGHTVDDLLREWRKRAADLGYDLGDLTRVVGLGATDRDQPSIDLDKVRGRLDVAAREQRPLSRRDLVALFSTSSVVGATAESIEAQVGSLVRGAGSPDDGIARVEPRWRAGDLGRALLEGIDSALGDERRIEGRHHLDRGPRLGPGPLRPEREASRDLELERPAVFLGHAP